MEDATSNRMTEIADSSDYESHNSHQSTGANDDDTDIFKSKEQHESDSLSLIQCRQTTSLVDELDDVDDDQRYDNVRDVSTGTSNTTDFEAVNKQDLQPIDSNVQSPVDDTIANTNFDKSRDGILQSTVTFTNGTPTTTSSTMRLPISTYLLSQSRLLSQNNPSQNWDHILRSGIQIKTLVAEAIGEVKNKVIAIQNNKNNNPNKRARDKEDDQSPSSNQKSRVVNVADFTVELAREKTLQVMQLQRVRIFVEFSCQL